jgi:hypothetical protein
VRDARQKPRPVRTRFGRRIQAGQGLDDQGKTVGEIIAGAAVELHLCAVLAGNDPKASVLDLVQPLAAERNLSLLIGRHGAMNPAGRVCCNMRA